MQAKRDLEPTIGAIDEVASTFNWPSALYLPQGVSANPWPLLKGRPLIMNENCSVIGTPGDLVLADWTQYHLAVRKTRPDDLWPGLAFDIAQPEDGAHQGLVALPEGVIEKAASEHPLFLSDEVCIRLKIRADGRAIWPSTLTTTDGSTVGWAAIIAQR